MASDRWVALGEVLRAHGIRGEVRVRLFNPGSHVVCDGVELRLSGNPDRQRTAFVERARPVPGGGLIVKFKGLDQREEAALLHGTTIEMRRDALPPAQPNEFYICDLVGVQVRCPNGFVGVVERVVNYPTADALVVRREGEPAPLVEIPLVDDFVDRIDLDQRVVILRKDALALLAE